MSENPYEPMFEEPEPNPVSPSFPFAGHVTQDDVARLLSGKGWLFVGLVLSLGLLWGLSWNVEQARDRLTVERAVRLAVAVILFLGSLRFVYLVWTWWKRFLRHNPHAIGRIRGVLSDAGLEAEGEHYHAVVPSEFLRFADFGPRFLIVSWGDQLLLPADLFDNFKGVWKYAAGIHKRGNLQFDDRAPTEPVSRDTLQPSPPNAILFGGELCRGDYVDTLTDSQIAVVSSTVWRGILAAGFVVLFVGYLFGFWGGLVTAICCVPLVFVSRKSARDPMRKFDAGDPDEVIGYVVGWISPDRVATAMFSGSATMQWPLFAGWFMPRDDTIVLRQSSYGCPPTLLTRRLFESEADWQQAIAWISENVEAENAPTKAK